MKRSLLVLAAALALGSASAYAQTAGVEPSFNDAPDLTPIPITGSQTVDNHFPKGSMNGSGGPTGPATVVVQGRDQTNARYAHSSSAEGGSTSSDAVVDDNQPKRDDPLPPTLNDTFHYPTSD